MEIPSILIGLFILGLSLIFVNRPFRDNPRKGLKAAKADVPTAKRREAILSAIRDLDFDFRTGKVGEEDYAPLRAQLLVEAAQLIDAAKSEDEKLESMIQARRASKQENKCEQCGASLEADQHFCAKCGSAVSHKWCPHCGQKVLSGDLYCTSCGTRLEVRAAAVA